MSSHLMNMIKAKIGNEYPGTEKAKLITVQKYSIFEVSVLHVMTFE